MSVLTEKLYRQYNRTSRYSPFPCYYHSLDKKYFQGTTSHLSTDSPYVAHTVRINDTWDSLALYYYNNPTYYWIICDFNRIQDPFVEPKVGTVLKIPTFSSINYDI